MKNDNLSSAVNAYIDKKINSISSDIARQKSLYKYGNFELKIGASSEDGMAIVWKQSGTQKMAIGVVNNKDGIATPLFVLGAGNGEGDNRGYIQKDSDGLSIYYIGDLSAGEVSYLKLTKDSANLNGYQVFSTKDSIADTYISSAVDWNNKTQNLDTSGDATAMNIKTAASGAKLELLDTGIFQSVNSSGQKHGMFIDKTYTDLFLYYNNAEFFRIYNGIDYFTFGGYGDAFLLYSSADPGVYAYGKWDFSSASVQGILTTWDGSHTHTINSAGSHTHSFTISGDGTYTTSSNGSHAHSAEDNGSHNHSCTTGI